MNKGIGVAVFVSLVAGMSGAVADTQLQAWQLGRLHHPSASQLAHEAQGSVFIYEGLTDRHVEQALARQFDRVGAMMFVNVQKTGSDGGVLEDPETGAPVTEDDGC